MDKSRRALPAILTLALLHNTLLVLQFASGIEVTFVMHREQKSGCAATELD
jgi:hypothetical protein